MDRIGGIPEGETPRGEEMTLPLLRFEDRFPCWDEETFSLAGEAPSALGALAAKGLLREAGGGYVLTPAGDRDRLKCAERLRIPAFAAIEPFDPAESLWNNRLCQLMRRAVRGRFGGVEYSLNEKLPILPGLSSGELWLRDGDGRVKYRWAEHPLIKSFLARFPRGDAAARQSAALGDAAMWRWAEAAGASFRVQSFNLVMRSRDGREPRRETPHSPADVFYMKDANRLFFLRTSGKIPAEIYDAIGLLHLFMLGQRRVYLPGFADVDSCGQENWTALVLAADGEEELTALRERYSFDGKNLIEPANPLFIIGTSVERLRKQDKPEDDVYGWLSGRSVGIAAPDPRNRSRSKAEYDDIAYQSEPRRESARSEADSRGRLLGAAARSARGPYAPAP